jgi:hypothetical protein
VGLNLVSDSKDEHRSEYDEIDGHVVHVGGKTSAYKILVRKFERKRPFGKPRHGWKDVIKMNQHI